MASMTHRWGNTSRHERGYGRAWDIIRPVIIARDNAICQPCLRIGRVTPFHAVDHITPKAKGGTDDEGNLECICRPCHDAKTKIENSEDQKRLRQEGRKHIGSDGWAVAPKIWGHGIPHGVRPAACKTHIIAGPPASGKTTYVAARASKGDKVIDLDEIKVRIGGKMWDRDASITARAMAYRDMAIRGLADRSGTAWLIITGQTKAARAAWLEALGPNAEMIVLDFTVDECVARIAADPRRKDAASELIHVVKAWQR